MSTADKVLTALATYDLKPEGSGKYRCNSPFRAGSNSHGFTLTITDAEHGAWFDHVSQDTGTLYQLAEKFGIEVPAKGVENTKRSFSGIDDYARAHGITGEILAAAKWYETTYQDRRALAFPTKTGTRWRFLDGQKPFYKSPKDYQRCWYGLNATAMQRIAAGHALVICNGEISTIAAQSHGLAAAAITGGEHDIPPHLLDDLKLFLGDLKPDILIAMDCDSTGRRVAKQVENQLVAVGYNAKALDLGLGSGGDLADFCKLYRDATAATLVTLAAIPDVAATETVRRPWYIIHADDLDKLPAMEWIIPGEIPARGITVVFGQSGAGKSFLTLDYALNIAQQQPVIYMAGEGEFGYRQRVAAWCKHHKKQRGRLYMCMGAVSMMQDSDLDAFIKASEPISPTVIFVDTMARSMVGADENSTRDMGLFITACESIKRVLDCAVVIIHHTNKGGFYERGNNALRGAADVMTRMYTEDDLILVECSKTKDARPFDTRYQRIIPVSVELDGREIESAVIIAADKVIQAAGDALTANQQKVLDALTLEVFAAGASVQDLAETTNIGRGSLHRVVSRLLDLGFIEQSMPREPYKISESGKKAAALNRLNRLNHPTFTNAADENENLVKDGDSTDSCDSSLETDDLVRFARDGFGAESVQLPLNDDDSAPNASSGAGYYEQGM